MPRNWFRVYSSWFITLVRASLIVKKQFNFQRGFFHLGIILAILAALISFLVFNYFKPLIKPTAMQATPSPTATQTASPKTTPNAAKQVDKKDKDWMNKYCAEEVIKLPEAPFKYKSKEGPIRSGAMVWISKMFPKDTRFDHQSGCRMDYKYDEKEAYASLGVKHKNDIKLVREFESSVDELLTSKIDSSWKKISPLTKEQSGNPGYTYQGFPIVFKRENAELGTTEYINIFFGAGTLYIKIEFYVKN